MKCFVGATLAIALFVVGVTCVPVDYDIPVPATELLPPEIDSGPTLATDLQPPPLPEEKLRKDVPATLFVINVFAVKNKTAEDSNDVLQDDVIGEVPDETIEPLTMFLLVVEEDDEDKPVSLDDVAKDLEDEGFVVEKIRKDGETRLIKVDLDSVESMGKVDESTMDKIAEVEKAIQNGEKDEQPLEETGKLTSIRRKRHICLKCKLDELKQKKYGHGGYGGGGYGGCNGGCGGGGGYPPVQIQPVIVAVPVHGGGGRPPKRHHQGGGGYYQPQPQSYYPQQPTCNTCGGGGGYGGGSSYAQASAQASAQSSSYGK